jgi:hypothetical protein
MACDMASHLIGPIGTISQETLSLERHSDTSAGNHNSDDWITDSGSSSDSEEITPVVVEDAFCKICSAIDFDSTRSSSCT